MLQVRPIAKSEIPDICREKHNIRDCIEGFADSEHEAVEVIAEGYKSFNVFKHAMLRGRSIYRPGISVVTRKERLFLVKP